MKDLNPPKKLIEEWFDELSGRDIVRDNINERDIVIIEKIQLVKDFQQWAHRKGIIMREVGIHEFGKLISPLLVFREYRGRRDGKRFQCYQFHLKVLPRPKEPPAVDMFDDLLG